MFDSKSKKREAPLLLSYCRRPGSNRYGYYYPRDFKSRASANSATAANEDRRGPIHEVDREEVCLHREPNPT